MMNRTLSGAGARAMLMLAPGASLAADVIQGGA